MREHVSWRVCVIKERGRGGKYGASRREEKGKGG